MKPNASQTTTRWDNCLIEPMFTIMMFVPDWPLHLCAVVKMLPYFFAPVLFNTYAIGCNVPSFNAIAAPWFTERMTGERAMRHQDGLWNAIWSDLFIDATYMPVSSRKETWLQRHIQPKLYSKGIYHAPTRVLCFQCHIAKGRITKLRYGKLSRCSLTESLKTQLLDYG